MRNVYIPLIVTIILSSAVCFAQEPNDAFWEARGRQKVGAAAEMVAAGEPFTILAMRVDTMRFATWDESEVNFDDVPRLDENWLDLIVDGTPMPDLRGKAPDEINETTWAAYYLFNQAVIQSSSTPLKAFIHSAQENSRVTIANLWNESAKYRGKVISIEGRLARLRRFDAPKPCQDQGILYLYEGWVFGPTRDGPPYCVIFPNLPKGLQEAEVLSEPVTFYGYYYKKYKYRTGDGDHFAPMLIGPTVTLGTARSSSERESVPFSIQALVTLGGMLVLMIVTLVLLGMWYRRDDRRFHKSLAVRKGSYRTDTTQTTDSSDDDNPWRDITK